MTDVTEIRNPERNEWLGIPADLLKKVQEVARAAAPYSPSTMLVDLLIADAPKALDKLSYGERISTGKGETWRPNAESLDLAGLVPQGKMAAAAKGIAASLLPKLGALGMVAGESAKFAPLLKLGKAKELEAAGATREQIFEHTGWWKGKDEKWRFEISDKGAEVKLPESDYAGTRVGAVMTHPELERQYPDLPQMQLQFWKKDIAPGEARAGYSNEMDMAFLKTADPAQAKRSLLHELQHAIQYREGFPTGGSPPLIQKAFPDLSPKSAEEVYLRLVGEVEARNTARRALMDEFQRKILPPWQGDRPEAVQTLLPQRLKDLP